MLSDSGARDEWLELRQARRRVLTERETKLSDSDSRGEVLRLGSLPEGRRVAQGPPAQWRGVRLSGSFGARGLSGRLLVTLSTTFSIFRDHLQLCHQLVKVLTSTYNLPSLVNGVDLQEGKRTIILI